MVSVNKYNKAIEWASVKSLQKPPKTQQKKHFIDTILIAILSWQFESSMIVILSPFFHWQDY